MARFWVYKCRFPPRDGQFASGDWATGVFDAGSPVKWGGTEYTLSSVSERIFREEMQPGDLVLAWQTDKRAAVGVCRVVRFDDHAGERALWLEPIERFTKLVKLHELKKSNPDLARVRALKQGLIQTVYETTPEEALVLLDACGSRLRP